jgi:hypothetical protein
LYIYQTTKQNSMMNKKNIILLVSFLAIVSTSFAQKVKQDASFSLGFADHQVTTALQYQHIWLVGKKKKLGIGTGARLTNSFGNKNFFTTAPAKLTTGKTGPGVFFGDQIIPNIDSVFFPKSQINALNLTINFTYDITNKIKLGFNIDAIGFSFGGSQTGTYYPNPGRPITTAVAKPTGFNLLLISDNDLGSLNSEFYAQYSINKKFAAKLGFQFLFNEYKTNTKIQTTPAGDTNDRFRYKSTGIAIGAVYNF